MSTGDRIGLILMVGAVDGEGEAIRLVHRARQAAALDSLEAARSTGLFDEIVVATNDPDWINQHPSAFVLDVDNPNEPFHFGRRLVELIERYRLSKVFYMGAGAAPLLKKEELEKQVRIIQSKDEIVVTNNLHSSDWAGFSPASILSSFSHRVERDNAIGWVLHREAGLPYEALPPSAASRLDIDTPTDLLILAHIPDCGCRLKDELALNKLDASRIEKAIQVMATAGKHIIVAGRVSSSAWTALEQGTLCWVRLFAEERGMVASGRQKNGQARSLLAEYMNQVGIERFFRLLESWSDAVFWDNRVVLAHFGLWPSDEDRFASDLGWPREVKEPFLAELTTAALESSIPIVMGGHSLVSGGLLALVESLSYR